MSWVPGGRGGFLRRIIGQEGDTVLRAGCSLAYERHGMSDFSDVFGTNPGIQVSANRDTATGTLLQDGLGFPVLLRDRGRLGPPNKHPANAAVPVHGSDHRRSEHLRREPAGAVLADVDRQRRPQDHAQHRHRRPVGRCASSPGLESTQLQRGEHPRKRLPRRVPPRAGQPASEYRGRQVG